MKIELLSVTKDSELLIERCARNCYQSNHRLGDNPKFLLSILKKGHLSILGHAQATFHIEDVSRALTHQLVRHRIATYSQKSQRYVKEDNPGYIVPVSIKKGDKAYDIYIKALADATKCYKRLIDNGIKKEDARYILPNATTTSIEVTLNFESWLHFFRMRLDKPAQWEIKMLAELLWKELTKHAPNVFSKELVGNVIKSDIEWDFLQES